MFVRITDEDRKIFTFTATMIRMDSDDGHLAFILEGDRNCEVTQWFGGTLPATGVEYEDEEGQMTTWIAEVVTPIIGDHVTVITCSEWTYITG